MSEKTKVYFDMETYGLNPYAEDFKILTAQIKIGHGKPIVLREWEVGEKKLIEQLVYIFSLLPDYCSIFVYNGYFDFSILVSRLTMLYYGNRFFMEGAYYEIFTNKKWCELLKYDNGYFMSFKKVCSKHGIYFKSKYRGRHIESLYNDKMYDEIVEHGIEDVESLCILVEKHGLGDRFL